MINQTINITNQSMPMFFGQTLPFTNSPTLDIFLLSLLVSLFITLVNKYLSDQVAIKALRSEMKELQKKMREIMKKNPKEVQKIQQKIMKKNLENMKYSMNPKIMLITMFPVLIVFTFISKYYSHFGEFFHPFNLVSWGWFGTYIFFSIITSIILKKILDVA